MRKSTWIRLLAVSAAGLAIAAGAVGAIAATQDADSERKEPARQADAQDEEQGPWLGIMAEPLEDGRVAIGQVVPGSPADKAGLEHGDVIKAVDGTDIKSFDDLRYAIDAKKAGDEVTLSVVKNGVKDSSAEAKDVKVTLEARPTGADLKGLLGDEFNKAFDRFLGGSFKYLDDNGETVEVQLVPGTVKGVSDTEITIDVNGDEGDRKFSIPDNAKMPDNLNEGDRVTVVLKDGEVQGVHPGAFGVLGHGLGIEGLPMPFDGTKPDGMPFGDGPFRRMFPHGGPFRQMMPGGNQNDNTAEPEA